MPQVLLKRRFKAMGGPCEVSLWRDPAIPAANESLFAQLQAEVDRLEAKYSRFQATSLLSRINRGELNNQALDAETCGLLNYIGQCFELSGQLFDPTVGILRRVWDYSGIQLPDPAALARLLPSIGWPKLGWNGYQLQMVPGMALDFGGVVKEFAVDRLVVMLKQAGVSGLVNLAGDIGTSGLQPGDRPWQVAVRHPRQAQTALATLDLAVGGLAGSGDYERFITVEGQRYSHLLRPDTGFPPVDGLAAITVLADSCLMAGSVATIAMLAGPTLAGQAVHTWLDEMNLPYLAVDQALNVFGSIKVKV
ncbi:FAD:protein FMN transferase [Reinekea sp.]|jgi:thiamine biosynthesis lipoprotein|uniref:FAD:protein FMN transferase n=1 Tax=Reinekea sp. TaxID=1970455 RepID=UPI002A840345|nr:FAD:protein FMN transferase [Reinekea sp.]